eukprot:gene6229-8584_t
MSAFPTDAAGKVEVAKTYKEEGNEHFKNGNYKKAVSSYGKSMAFIKGLPGRKSNLEGMTKMAAEAIPTEVISDELNHAIDDLEVVLKTNLATCYIKLDNPTKALENIKNALDLNPLAWKAILRKGEAIMLKKDYEKAIAIFDDVLNNPALADTDPVRQSILKTKEKALKLNKQEELKQKKSFSNIFERASQQQIKEDQQKLYVHQKEEPLGHNNDNLNHNKYDNNIDKNDVNNNDNSSMIIDNEN